MHRPLLRLEFSRRHAWAAATLLLIVLLAAHPELRLLVPLVDLLGADTLMLLCWLQAIALLGPLPAQARAVVAALARRLDRASERHAWLGFPREFARYAVFHWIHPRLWLRLHRGRLALQG
jgi:hypothetical protein